MVERRVTPVCLIIIGSGLGGGPGRRSCGSRGTTLKALEGLPVLGITEEAEKFARALVEVGPISETHIGDAVHIALATINGMDYLMTWNFRHINNARMKKEIAKVAEENGYECPVICSP